MKTSTIFTAALIAIGSLASNVYAEDGPRFGLGTGYSSGGSVGFLGIEIDLEEVLTPVSLYAPITFGNFRIEPEIGYIRSAQSDDNVSITNSTFQLGSGFLGLHEIVDRTRLYYGARLGLSHSSVEADFNGEFAPDDESESRTNFYIGPALGTEYMPNDHFSLGGEAQLLYTSIDDPDSDISLINTRTTLFVRVYF